MAQVYAEWQATSELGFTRCDLLRFVVDVVGILGGALLASKGFVEAQKSGSLLTWGAPNPTGRAFSSETPSSPKNAEEILGKDLRLSKFEGRFYSSDYGLEAESYRQPDYVGSDFIADSKWYSRASVSSDSQLRDYVTIALVEHKKLWIYVRLITHVTEQALSEIRRTGGNVVYYFP